jgi:hypothetical protein
VYVANYDSSTISVIRDSMSGIEESPKPQASSRKPAATVVRGAVWLAPTTSPKPQAASLLDAAGRKVMELHSGANDVSRLAPGVYFVQKAQAQAQAQAARKVVIAK